MKEVLSTAAVIAAIATLCRAFYKKGYKEGCKYAFQQQYNEERKYSHFKKKHSNKQKGQSKVTS